ncbi:unnamed protein product [Miscanthus lutarioriparius]|uniref:Uncharacterized protein n=1 Tax=Miscanthus lutarioriparius TaxID=422564 RepID=A0A811MY14_9POAL|nr:unnamed protein product [Miscanthus lutarioriparius]
MMKLSRPVHATMLMLLLLLACHRFQLSDCAKPSSPREKAAVLPSAHRHDAEDDAHLPSMETTVGDVVGSSRTTNDAAGLAAPSSDATPVQGLGVQGKEEEGVGSGPWQQQRTGAIRTALLLRSRLPRRFLAAASGVESGTDGAGLSCHSHDVHVNCPPPSKR